jgi:hypothetical protein
VGSGGATRNRTTDTRIFSPVLYLLSYGTNLKDIIFRKQAFFQACAFSSSRHGGTGQLSPARRFTSQWLVGRYGTACYKVCKLTRKKELFKRFCLNSNGLSKSYQPVILNLFQNLNILKICCLRS